MNNLLGSEWFKSIATLVLGWLLSEIGHYLLARRERRKAISGALSNLLEIRHHFVSLEAAVTEIKKLIPKEVLPANAELQLRVAIPQIMQQFFPQWQEMAHEASGRYNESVTLVASIDPLLGYQLRSKDLAQHVFGILNSLFAQDAQVSQLWQQVNQSLFEDLASALDSYLKRLAWKISPITWWKTRRMLRDSELPEAAEKILGIVRQGMQQSVAQAQPDQDSRAGGTRAGMWVPALFYRVSLGLYFSPKKSLISSVRPDSGVKVRIMRPLVVMVRIRHST